MSAEVACCAENMRGYVKFIVFGSACSQSAAKVKELLYKNAECSDSSETFVREQTVIHTN